MRLTLLVPELIWPEPGDQLTLGKLQAPSFTWLDGHAAFSRSTPLPFEKALLDLFGLPNAGLANFRRLGETGTVADAGHWLCADPVHLRFHHERIVLADAGAFDLDDTEAQALVDSLNAEFSDIGVFHAATARRWYLRLHTAVDHVAAPLSAVAGRRMDSELQDKTSPLHRWLNEVQMFLHLHPINATRAAAGQPAVNSLWLWGNGAAATPDGGPDAVFANDPLANGLARAAGLTAQTLPISAETVLTSNAQNPLVVLDHLLPTVLYENPDDWRRAFEMLDTNWFAPLRTRLGKSVKTITIVAPTIYGQLKWTLAASDRWKFWKSGRPPAKIAQALATPAQGNLS